MELGICEMSSTPFLRSSTNSVVSVFQMRCRARRGGRQEGLVAVVRLVVLLDEVANVDLLLPEARPEAVPRRRRLVRLRCVAIGRHVVLLRDRAHARGSPVPAAARCAGRSSVLRWSGSPTPTPCWPAWRFAGPCVAFASASSSMPSHAEASQIRAADLRRVLADAGREDQAVDAAQHRRERADLLGRAVDEVVDGEPRRRLGAARADRACRC